MFRSNNAWGKVLARRRLRLSVCRKGWLGSLIATLPLLLPNLPLPLLSPEPVTPRWFEHQSSFKYYELDLTRLSVRSLVSPPFQGVLAEVLFCSAIGQEACAAPPFSIVFQGNGSAIIKYEQERLVESWVLEVCPNLLTFCAANIRHLRQPCIANLLARYFSSPSSRDGRSSRCCGERNRYS